MTNVFKNEGRLGTGNWSAFPKHRVDEIFEAAADWNKGLRNIEKPWLCWSMDPEWCVMQQKLVAEIGWTPVVGWNHQSPKPTIIRGAVQLDFNQRLKLPGMWMHFPLEFAFRFSEKLAFWHSDVLLPADLLRQVVSQFETISDGQMVALRLDRRISVSGLNELLQGRNPVLRCFEVLGCTTRGASQSQFENGCGWWRHIEDHPNAQARIIERNPHWETGVGIYYWMKHFGGQVDDLCINVQPYHYSKWSNHHKKSYWLKKKYTPLIKDLHIRTQKVEK